MTVDDALKAMSAIESQRDGSQAMTVIVQALNRKLLEDPENFWEFYFKTLNAADLNPYQALAERLLRSGAVNEETTIGEMRPKVSSNKQHRGLPTPHQSDVKEPCTLKQSKPRSRLPKPTR